MECPECGGKTSVINSREVEANVFRARECKKCKHRFYTEEVEIDKEEADEYMAFIKEKDRNRHKIKVMKQLGESFSINDICK